MTTSRNGSPPAELAPRGRLLARRHVARIFGVSVSTVTRWAQLGLLPSVRTPGGHYRFPEASVARTAGD
ncbi:MAG: helix-turn-helix domain-containing protein [Acidobacteria bacterium]|nr:helix-turn-helix domain-containing protein [Acidobacteriota bacterium]